LLDFCYITNGLALAHLFLAPASPYLFEAVFLLANGPVLWAILAWRNSMVFHDPDKMTSVFIHIFPALLSYAQRWHAPGPLLPAYLSCVAHEGAPARDTACDGSYWRVMGVPLALYLLWQAAYLLFTEWSGCPGRRALRADPGILTSLRWLARTRGGMTALVTNFARRAHILSPGEELDDSKTHTKVLFVATQLVYFCLTLAPTKALFDSKAAHAALLLCLTGLSVWQGGSYYIEEFASRYAARLERAEALWKAAGGISPPSPPLPARLVAYPSTASATVSSSEVGTPEPTLAAILSSGADPHSAIDSAAVLLGAITGNLPPPVRSPRAGRRGSRSAGGREAA
jgi:hypothetical protein